MTKHKQTIFGNKKGNCFSACVACLLDMPVEDVPNWCADVPEGQSYLLACQQWLGELGYVLVGFDMDNGHFPQIFSAMQDGLYCTCGGKSPRGDFLHEVVGQYHYDSKKNLVWIEPVHDPHTDNTFLDGPVKDVTFIFRRLDA